MKMLRWNLKNDVNSLKQEKTKIELEIPVHPKLAAVLAEIPLTSTHLLVNSAGLPWTQDGFRSSFIKAINAVPELDGLRFHGLRKSAVEFLLETGCTDAEVESITGQSRQTIAHYPDA
jgi:integrase